MHYRDATTLEENALQKAHDRIAAVDGRALFESGNFTLDGHDGLFDMFGLPDVFDDEHVAQSWLEMTPDERDRWDALAAVLRAFAFDRLDDQAVMDHADHI